MSSEGSAGKTYGFEKISLLYAFVLYAYISDSGYNMSKLNLKGPGEKFTAWMDFGCNVRYEDYGTFPFAIDILEIAVENQVDSDTGFYLLLGTFPVFNTERVTFIDGKTIRAETAKAWGRDIVPVAHPDGWYTGRVAFPVLTVETRGLDDVHRGDIRLRVTFQLYEDNSVEIVKKWKKSQCRTPCARKVVHHGDSDTVL